MSLKLAMQGIIAATDYNPFKYSPTSVAQNAVEAADALLAELGKSKQESKQESKE